MGEVSEYSVENADKITLLYYRIL